MKKIITSILLTISFIAFSQKESVSLYPGKAPGSENWDWNQAAIGLPNGQRIFYNVSSPELWVFPAPKEKANGTSVIIAPGGAFHILSVDNEGKFVAEALNKEGITAIVLNYRVVKSQTNNPFAELMPLMADFKKLDEINAPVVEMATHDGIEAMKWTKANAERLGIDPNKIGFMGFSAGGTLTMSVAMSAPENLKPNWLAPIYLYRPAVIGNTEPKKETPIFIAVASDDELKFVPHSISLYQDWMKNGHEAELHIYEKGGHGFGISPKGTSSDQWFNDFKNWLKIRKLL